MRGYTTAQLERAARARYSSAAPVAFAEVHTIPAPEDKACTIKPLI